MRISKHNLLSSVIVYLGMIVMCQNTIAAPCTLDNTFPTLLCPFSAQEKISVKFGRVNSEPDFAFVSGLELLIRFNSARYRIKQGSSWRAVGSCIDNNILSPQDLGTLSQEIQNHNGQIAFTVNPDNVREITKVWFLNCEVISGNR